MNPRSLPRRAAGVLATLAVASTTVATLVMSPAGASSATASSDTRTVAELLRQRRHAGPRTAPLGDAAAAGSAVERLAGADRYETAAAISRASWPEPEMSGGIVFVATGTNFPDALAGGAAAAGAGPMLLVERDVVPQATARELARLDPFAVVVFGGTGVISDAVAAELASYTELGADGILRIGGVDRYDTAAQIATLVFGPYPDDPYEFTGLDVVYVATGSGYADALSGTAAAAWDFAPMLLTGKDSLPPATALALQVLQPRRIVVLGGTSAVSNAVLEQLQAIAPTPGAVSRISGADRFETAANVSKQTFRGAPTVFVATGMSFTDALAGATMAGIEGAPLLLVPSSGMTCATRSEIARLRPYRVVVLGGTNAVSQGVEDELRDAAFAQLANGC